MSELISGDEAKKAWANGETVQVKCVGGFFDLAEHRELLNVFDNPENIFRLAPRTITINGIEVPAPFEPKEDCIVFIIDDGKTCNYRQYDYEFGAEDESNWIGIWRTEEEIKQVVAALRSIFKTSEK